MTGVRHIVDLGAVDAVEADGVVEGLFAKAAGRADRIWQPHPVEGVLAAEASRYEWGAGALRSVYLKVAARAGAKRPPDSFERPAGHEWFAKAAGAGDDHVGLLDIGIDEWMRVVDGFVRDYLPEADAVRAAEADAVRAYLAGRVRDALGGAGTLRDRWLALPDTAKRAEKVGIGALDREALAYARARAATHVQDLASETRSAVRETIVAAHQAKATPARTARTLFDRFADLNRDWRRVAITEAAENFNQGFLAAHGPGARVVRREAVDACTYCKAIDGQEFTIVSPDKEPRDWDAEVWVGKSNFGRSRHDTKRVGTGFEARGDDELWKPCPVVHPHCRGYFEALS